MEDTKRNLLLIKDSALHRPQLEILRKEEVTPKVSLKE